MSNLESTPWFVIVNPIAGAHRGHHQWRRLEGKLQKCNIAYVVRLTKGVGDACNLVPLAFQQNFRNFIVVGGDGTHHEFINGLMSLPHDKRAMVCYALFPAGTGNDFARHFGIPKMVDRWIDYLDTADISPIDVGGIQIAQSSPIYFINEAGLGLEATVVQRLTAKRSYSRSNLRYLFGAVRTLFGFTGVYVRFSDDTSSSELHLLNMTIANCRYLGGGFQLAPQASPLDGQLTVAMISKTSKWTVLRNIINFFNGKVGQLSYTNHWQTSRILVEPVGDLEVLIQVDGEIRGSLPAEFCVFPKAVNFYIPFNFSK